MNITGKKIKILIIITTRFAKFGGIANAFMNYYRYMNLENLQIDVVSCTNHDNEMGAEIERNGGMCYDVPSKQKNVLKYVYALNKIMRQGYDVVDVHGNSGTMLVEMWLAKRNKVPNRMAHCLNSKANHAIIHNIMKPLFNSMCTTRTACTKQAGYFLYGKRDFTVLRNTVPLEEYHFSNRYREEIRSGYSIENDQILLGTVGKINHQKNQGFLLDVIAELKESYDNLKFMIVGDGALRPELESKISDLGLENVVILAGMQSDVIPYYSAFDIYVFPSLFEGESLALIEARCSGVYVCASELIRLDEKEKKNIVYQNLDVKCWTDTVKRYIHMIKTQDRYIDSTEVIAEIKEEGVDSVDNAELLKELYCKCP